MRTEWKNQVHNLVCTGNTYGDRKREIDETEVELALTVLRRATAEDPAFLLEAILTASTMYVTGMVTLALAVLFSKADQKFFQDNKDIILNILLAFDAFNLLELVRILKQKSFGRGLGSRSQKMIRRVMESWTNENLKTFITLQPTYLYGLLRLIHPRYHGERADLIKDLLEHD